MFSHTAIILLTSLVTVASSTGLLLPLYVYPSAVWNDGAAKWTPVFNAIQAQPNLPWLVVANVDSGPGGSRKPGNEDVNYIAGVSKLNSYKNVKTIGYVRTDYARSPMNDLKANMTAWSGWSTYTASNIAVNGIFFDECTGDNLNYLTEAITFARSAFKNPITVVCNFGVKASADYYRICDVVIAYESSLNAPNAPPYQGKTTLQNNVIAGSESKAAIIVNFFTGNAVDGSVANTQLLSSYMKVISAFKLGWCYFTSADYDEINMAPASIGEVAKSLAAANT